MRNRSSRGTTDSTGKPGGTGHLVSDAEVVIGVDTHKHTHTAAAVSSAGGVLGELTVTSTGEGYAQLLRFADGHAQHVRRRVWAVEGTASYGAGLACFLRERSETVLEVDRPRRTARRMGAKTDAIDAVRAAREALGQERHATPRQGEQRAALATLLAARRSAVAAATAAHRQLQDLVVTAPEPIRAKLRGVSSRSLLPACAGLRRSASGGTRAST